MNLPTGRSGDECSVGDTLRRIADDAPTIIWMTDADRACTYISAADIPRESLAPVMSLWVEFIHAEDRVRLAPQYHEARNAQREFQVEFRIVRSDGSTRWMRASAAPRFAADGVFLGYAGAMIDVSSHHKALQELAQSEAMHRLMTENSSDLISHHGLDGKLINISPACRRVLGYEPAEMVGTTIYNFLHGDDIVAMHAMVKQLSRRDETGLFELRFRHKAGHYVWIASKARALLDPVSGVRVGTVSVGRDVTLERRAKEELARREERFRRLTHLSSDWYWETDEEDRFTFLSEGAWRMVQSTPLNALGRRRADFAVDHEAFLRTGYEEKIAARLPFRDLHYACGYALQGVERHLSISGEPVYENGSFKGYRGVGRDITDEVAMARQLSQLAAENKALVDNSLDIMMMFGADARIIRINAAVEHILGYQQDELLGRVLYDFVHPEDREHTRSLQPIRPDEEYTLRDFENRWLRKDGSTVHLSWASMYDPSTGMFYATARDISEAHSNRLALHHSNMRLAGILDSIGDAFFALDDDWRCTYVNRKTAEFVGRDSEELIGKLLWERMPEVLGTSFMAEFRRVMETRKKTFFVGFWEPKQAWVEVKVYPGHPGGIAVFFHDVTQRRRAEAAIRESEQRLRQVIEMTPAGYLLTDADGFIVDVNPALCSISGHAREWLVGQPLGELFPVFPQPGPAFAGAHGHEAVLRHRSGRPVYVLVNLDVRAGALTAFITDITERKQTEARLEQLASHDTLTNLPNRSSLNERLQRMLDTAGPTTQIAVIFIDLDRFKEVNDSLGHERGDLLLREVARRLQQRLRPTDIVARLGGDEFVVAAHCTEGDVSAASIADKLLTVLAEPIDVAGHEVFVGASAGISMFPRDGATRELLFQNADTAMYRAKNGGRNGFRFFEQEMSVEAKTRMTLEHSLRRALERDEFELHYQPRLELRSGRILGMEALIRWTHPQLGQVSPLQFIPIAEERGLIEAIGRWVLREACAYTSRINERYGLALKVSVNLSARQLKCHDLREQVLDALTDAGLAPSLLELELTESALIDDMEISAERLAELKKLGIKLSVDDFGTGYSGLAYLQRFPLDVMKLDRSFIKCQTDGPHNLNFIKALIDLAHTLDLSVVAEGIESEDILKFLTDSRCDEGQGYLFAKPMQGGDFEELIEREMARSGALH